MREACEPRPSPLKGGSHIREGLSSQPLSGLNALMQEDLDRVLFDEATILRRLDELARDITAEYEGRELGNVEIEDARSRLTNRYIKDGYVNLGFEAPQTVRILREELKAKAEAGTSRPGGKR